MIASLIAPVAALALLSVPAPGDTVLKFPSGALTLEGSLMVPAGRGPWPAVVIVAGSGPTDRNGNSPAGVSSDAYLMLAQALAERGVASFRYDKRVLPSASGARNAFAMTMDDFARDAEAAVRFLKTRADLGPVALLGHSEGGTLAIMAARNGAPVAGLVLVSSLGRDLTTVMREQLARQLTPPLLAAFDTAWARFISTDSAVTAPQGLEVLFQPSARGFLKSWKAIDPVELLRRQSLPTLVVQGETDLQVTPADARLLGSARPDVQVVLLPGVNHVLKLDSGTTIGAQSKSYGDKTIPLAPEVAPAIASFVLGLKGG